MFNPDFLGVLPSDPEYFKAECMKRSAEIMRDAANILVAQPREAPFIIWQSVYWYYLYIRHTADIDFIVESENIISEFKKYGDSKPDEVYLEFAQKLYGAIQKFIIRQKWIIITKFSTAIVRAPDDPDFERNVQVASEIVEAIDDASQEEDIQNLATEITNKNVSITEAKERMVKLFGTKEENKIANELE